VKQVSASEFLIGLGLIIGSVEFDQNVKDLVFHKIKKKHIEVESVAFSPILMLKRFSSLSPRDLV